MDDLISPTPLSPDQSFEPREVTVAGLENPKQHEIEDVPMINMYRLQEFFGIDQADFKQEALLNNIYKHFEKSGVESMNDVYKLVSDYERKLGNLPQGQNRLMRLWSYLKILSQIKDYDELKQSYEHGTT